MKKSLLCAASVASVLPALLFADYSTSFTTADGYSNGDLNSQQSWTANGTGSEIFTVQDAASSGSVDIGAVTGNATITFNAETYDFTQVGATYTLSADFQFTDAGDTTATNSFFKIQYGYGSVGNVDDGTSLVLRKSSSETYQLARYAKNAASLSVGSLGLDPGVDDLSDVLRLTSVFTGGGTDAAAWSVDYTLFNVTTDTVVLSGTITGLNLNANSIGNTDMYGLISTGAFGVNNHDGIGSITLLDYSSAFAAVPEPSFYASVLGLFTFAFIGYRRNRVKRG